MTYRLHPEAALEHERQVAYYEKQRAGLGRRNHEATLHAIEKAVETPGWFKIVRPSGIREIALHGVKVWVIYREVDDAVQILGIAHFRRHPDYWLPRA